MFGKLTKLVKSATPNALTSPLTSSTSSSSSSLKNSKNLDLALLSLSDDSPTVPPNNGQNLPAEALKLKIIRNKAKENLGFDESDDTSSDEEKNNESKNNSSNPFDDDSDDDSDDEGNNDAKGKSGTNPFADEDDENPQPQTQIPQRKMSLPPSNTPLGRFLRLHNPPTDPSHPSSSTSVPPSQLTLPEITSLLPNPSYLSESYSPLPPLISSIPWGTSLGPYLKTRLEKLNLIEDTLQTNLNAQVQKHQGTLMGFTEILSSVSVKTVECLIETRAARAKLKDGSSDGTQTLEVLRQVKVRTRLEQVKIIVKELQKVCRIMAEVKSGNLTTKEEVDAVEDIRSFVSTSNARDLKCLDDVRRTIPEMFEDVRTRGIMGICDVICDKFEWGEYYERVVGVVRCEVVRTEMNEWDLGRDVREEVMRRFDNEVMRVAATWGEGGGSIGECIRNTAAGNCKEIFGEVSEKVVDIMHCMYLCEQAHRDWGSEKNEDWEYLHRSSKKDDVNHSFDDDEEDEDESSEDENSEDDDDGNEIDLTNAVANALTMKKSDPNPNPTSSSSSASKTQNDSLDESSSDSKIAKITSVKITLLARTLRQHLNAVWRHAEGILKQVVERMREGDMSDVGAEGVKRVVDCCRQLVSIMEEDFGADTHDLSTAVSDLTRGFFSDVHAESVEVALGMVDREDWRGVEVGRVRGRRGLVKLVNNNSSSSNDEERTPAFDVKKNVMSNWPKSGNPLHPPSEEDNEEHSNPEEEDSQRQSSDNTSTLWPGSQQNVYSDEEDEDQNPFWREISVNWDQDPPTTTLTVLNGLTKFIGKYMDIIRTLPSITTDVASGMQRLVDMYFLCVINVALNGAQPEEVWAKTTSADQNWMEKMGDMMHGRRLEMCRPVEAESNEYESVINFIRRARKKIGQLEVTPAPATYEAKISALESLMFLAALLSSIQSKIPTLNAYIDEVVDVTPKIVRCCGRVASVLRIDGDAIMRSIVEVGDRGGWDTEELMEGSNNYVDDALDLAAAVWAELAGRDGYLNERLLELAWQHIIGGIYISLLEGFAKIKSFSTEGRALVSMDLQTFASGIMNNLVDRIERIEKPPPPPPPPPPPASSSTNPFADDENDEEQNSPCNPFNDDDECEAASKSSKSSSDDDEFIVREPPKVTPPRGKNWVDSYVKAWYFDEVDLLKWITQNKGSYNLHHSVALVVSGVGRHMKKRDLKNLLTKLEQLYA
ncbi:hypothetical protein TrST_g12661 [Triparma strigata]|uniref:Syndetin C-terminal domain-containing protein n=1 Tax=Triparma strigata TaxID=1606541 RepID=A0A9W7BWC2_9STRA|nr:hypothetical protein TrST_g12661 [Triparma strigata]